MDGYNLEDILNDANLQDPSVGSDANSLGDFGEGILDAAEEGYNNATKLIWGFVGIVVAIVVAGIILKIIKRNQ